MSSEITISLWIFLVLLLISGWALLEKFLIPIFRWFFKRRINRVIDELSSRLDIEIRPFQLTKRQILMDRLVYDPKVMEVVRKEARTRNMSLEAIQTEVLAYAKEIVPSFNAYIYFRIGYWLAKKVARLLYRVRVGMVDNEELAAIDPDSTVVFAMNHRSNMDYILVAYLAAERTALSYAVGEWARIWPLHTLIRWMGAFFVRRNSGNPLYRLVLERYIHMATKEGVCQAVFLEGGLSRDGALRPPKLGLVDYMLRSFDSDKDRDIVFIPVGINYDRTLEDRSLLRMMDPRAEKRSKWFVLKTTIAFIWHNLMLMVFSRWKRFGYACVNFGSYVSVREYCRRKGVDFSRLDRNVRFAEVENLCKQLMASIGQIIPILPICLVATVVLQSADQWLGEFEIRARVYHLIEQLEAKGAPLYLPRRGGEEAITAALEMLKLRRMVSESEGLLRADPGSSGILSYYANAIGRWSNGPHPTRSDDA